MARNKNPVTLTKTWDEMDKYRLLYASAKRAEFAVKNAKRNKPLKKSDYYAKKYEQLYKDYYKNGGQQKREVYDYTYSNITKSNPLNPDPTKRKRSGTKKTNKRK